MFCAHHNREVFSNCWIKTLVTASLVLCSMHSFSAPLNILFIGNSYTSLGYLPTKVSDIAMAAGHERPNIGMSAPAGRSLDDHNQGLTSARNMISGPGSDWDFVVLQEFSTRATDNAGDPDGFKQDATELYDFIKANNQNASVVLFETWARADGHKLYSDGIFSDPEQMQQQLSSHYNNAADDYISLHSATAVDEGDLLLAPVGSAWQASLNSRADLLLHANDWHHAGEAGNYLSALVLFSTIYREPVSGIPHPPGGFLSVLDDANVAHLQAISDSVTEVPVPASGPLFAFLVSSLAIWRRQHNRHRDSLNPCNIALPAN